MFIMCPLMSTWLQTSRPYECFWLLRENTHKRESILYITIWLDNGIIKNTKSYYKDILSSYKGWLSISSLLLFTTARTSNSFASSCFFFRMLQICKCNKMHSYKQCRNVGNMRMFIIDKRPGSTLSSSFVYASAFSILSAFSVIGISRFAMFMTWWLDIVRGLSLTSSMVVLLSIVLSWLKNWKIKCVTSVK